MDRYTRARKTAAHGRDYYNEDLRAACPGFGSAPEDEELWTAMSDTYQGVGYPEQAGHDVVASMLLDGADCADDPEE